MGVERESAGAGFVPLFGDGGGGETAAKEDVTAGGAAGTVAGTDFFMSGIDGMKRKAYKKGYSDGEKQALSRMSGQLQEQIARWQQMLTELAASVELEMESFLKMIEERTVSLSVQIAKKIVEGEIKADPESIGRRVETALSFYKSEPGVGVRVNPKDIVFLRQLVPPNVPADAGSGVEGLPLALSDASLVEDPSVEPGGFVVETPVATFDHTIRSQLMKIATDLARLYESSDD